MNIAHGISILISLAASLTLTGSTSGEDSEQEFQYPVAVTADQHGTVYVADRNLPGIWKITGGTRSLLFRGSRTFRTPLNAVRCLAIDHQGFLLAGDSATRDVYRFDSEGIPHPLTNGWIGIPMALAVAPDGSIYTADLERHRIWKMPAEGASRPEEVIAINSPRGLTLDADGNLWVLSTSSRQGQVQQVLADGTVRPAVTGHPFQLPHNIVPLSDTSFAVTDNYAGCVWKVERDGSCSVLTNGSPLDRPVGLCRLPGQDLLVADPHIRTLFRITAQGTVSVFAGPIARRPETSVSQESP